MRKYDVTTSCYVIPVISPMIGLQASFSLMFWIWLDSNRTGHVTITVVF